MNDYNKDQLQEIFQQKFNASVWQDLLIHLFQAKDLRQTPELLNNSTENETGYYLGKITMSDGLELGLFRYKINKGSVAIKRVGLRNLVKTFTNPRYGIFDCAFVVFDDGQNWRVSFISDIKGEITAPKRYTFVFGDAEQYYHTAVSRFWKLQSDGVTFKTLMDAFSVDILTKEFYKELFSWYQWALSDEMAVTYPNDTSTEEDDRIIQEHLIRLITRLMFVWFVKQKLLIPNDIFDIVKLQEILKDFDPESNIYGDYYNAILQNLFFATLNRPIKERIFATNENFQGKDKDYGIKTKFRDANEGSWFKFSHDQIIKLFERVPFLNGGLFECLDKEKNNKIFYYDGFSRAKGRQKRAFIPNSLFFDKDKGLISILKRYNFTIEENTPNDVDVALDPELLGKVFENLLGAYNPETKETARKQSGSFYTPREIVNYMVEESLIAYLKQTVGEEYESDYKDLSNNLSENLCTLPDKVKSNIYNSLRQIKIFDPACGSGAFPMGVLNGIVGVFEKLDLPQSIDRYNLKLHLIENCIYGVDIQTIATQISKLRFFISLVCEQTPNQNMDDNYGIKPLPNLETKFIAANALIGIKKKPAQGNLFEDPQIEVTKKDLLQVRHKHFLANTPKQKSECRKEDEDLRDKLAKLLAENNDFAPKDAKQLAQWNPYDQNTVSSFFDIEWMFGIADGFDIVIGNPPYVQLQNNSGELAKLYEKCDYKTFARTGDLYCLFYERGYQLLKSNGLLCFITSNKWMRAGYGESTRRFLSENTNPEQLIDFAGIKVFDSATVDTNILMFTKDKNRQQTQACIVKKDGIKKLSDFVRQNASVCNFGAESWVVLSPIEQRIKAKIEAVGTPLKDWDINIYRGILTGYNEAFIIDDKKKEELIAQDPKSVEIIRPILRGRDIKRYGYNRSKLWLINTHNGIKGKGIPPIDINDYPAVKHWLDFGGIAYNGKIYEGYKQIEKRADQGDTPYNLRNCAYMKDFYKQKIMYSEIVKEAKFFLDKEGKFLPEATTFILTGENLEFLYAAFHTKAVTYFFKKFYAGGGLGEDGYRYKKKFLESLPIPKPKEKIDIKDIEKSIYELYKLSDNEIEFIESQ